MSDKIKDTLMDISLAMSEGDSFVKILWFLNDLEQRAEKDDVPAQRVLEVVKQFKKLCDIGIAGRT